MNVEAGGARTFAPRSVSGPAETMKTKEIMKKYFLILLALGVATVARAARIDTVAVQSACMQREIPALVIVPEAAAEHPLPVLYLLHGYSGSHTAWQGITDLRPLSETYSMIIVCPDGENSWYWDSPINPAMRYETFVSQELPDYVDQHYPTIADRTGRAITGLSMGGHGAMWISIRHSDRFGASGATSGGVDIRPFPENWNMADALGKLEDNREVWENHTVINLVDQLENGELAIIFERLGIDTLEVLEAAGSKWNFLPFRPGLVGGHCIGVDPYYLTYKAEEIGCHPEVILSGRRINDGMGKYVAETCVKRLIEADRRVKGARVGILGFTFKENVPDIRNTRVVDIVAELKEYGITPLVHDPEADPAEALHEYGQELLPLSALSRLDALILAVAHDSFRSLTPEAITAMFEAGPVSLMDIKGFWDKRALREAGFDLWRL